MGRAPLPRTHSKTLCIMKQQEIMLALCYALYSLTSLPRDCSPAITFPRFLFSYRSTVGNNPVVDTPYNAAPFRYISIFSIYNIYNSFDCMYVTRNLNYTPIRSSDQGGCKQSYRYTNMMIIDEYCGHW